LLEVGLISTGKHQIRIITKRKNTTLIHLGKNVKISFLDLHIQVIFPDDNAKTNNNLNVSHAFFLVRIREQKGGLHRQREN
jgi:hypothetical protein